MDTTSYAYDSLNRRVTQTTTGAGTTSFSYLGTSTEVASESGPGGTSKTYDYTPSGARLSQDTTTRGGSSSYGYYSYNSHSDVEAVTGSSGTTTATYGYTAYGNPVTSMFTGADKNDATASSSSTTQPYSAYRFNAMRWDGTSGSYDMGFRNYDPGLNQFDSRDMYDGATADMGLTADPFTGSLYAFGNGNPVSNIENDGHCANTADAICPGQTPAATAAAGKQETIYNRNNIGSYIESMILFDNPQIANSPSAVNKLTSLISGRTSHPASSPTPINNPGWADPSKTHLPPIAYAGIAATNWFSANKALSDYFTARGQVANSDFTIILSEVQVETSEGSIPRIIAFTNANGLPRPLRNQLDKAGVKIFKANPSENHAEIAAANFRASPEQQEAYLGGQISKVNSAVMNNLPCSQNCADNYTEYIGREDVTIETTDRGILANGEVINQSVAAELRAAGGGDMYAGLVDPAIFDDPEGYQP